MCSKKVLMLCNRRFIITFVEIFMDKVNDFTRPGVLSRIRESLAPEIESMNGIIRSALSTDHSLVNSIIDNYLHTKGKQIRPILVMLSARMFGRIDETVLYAAASLEMLHNATLIHDDVVDQTLLRRGEPSLNAVWGNHLAVLSGDIFVSKALVTGIRTRSLEILESLSELGTELSLGEMDQLFNARRHVLNRRSYFKMIERKTASLFMGCIRIGAQAAGAKAEDYERLVEFGRLLGLAFQIRDDIFDYFPSDDIGKPSGHDLLEGKVTLPLLHALEFGPEPERQKYMELLGSDEELTPESISRLQEFAKANGGIEEARKEMERLREEGVKILREYPESECRNEFEEIFDYIIRRTY